MPPPTTDSEVEPLLQAVSTAADSDDVQSAPRSTQEEARSKPIPVPKLLATLLSFVVLGLIISTPGVVLPRLESHYHLSDVQASRIFLVAPIGYLVGARLNDPVHTRLGQRGVAVIAPLCQAVFTGAICLFHNPHRAGFPLFLLATVVGNVGSGLLDGSWCAWAGGLGGRRTNTIQGLLHGSFSVGAGIGPFLAGSIFSVLEWPWWTWYNALFGAVVIQAIALFLAFRFDDGTQYREALTIRAADQDDRNTTSALESSVDRPQSFLHYRVTWTCAAYFLVYVGTESAISGWIVIYMQRVRHASPYLASLSSSAFWAGMAVGRLVLGPVTDRFSVRPATASYLIIAIMLQAGLFLPVTAPAIFTAFIAGIGFFLGPLFPSGIVVLARALPQECLVSAVSFVAAVGQLGAAVLPFALGATSSWAGIWVFQGFILALLATTLLVWSAMSARRVDRIE